MKYITINDLSNTIRKNIWKIPRDIDFIIGVPRSGMIAASIISSYLNIPLIDIKSFISGEQPYGGYRLKYFNQTHNQSNKVLVVDDTVFCGTTMQKIKNSLHCIKDKTFLYMCVYLEGVGENAVDFYLEDIRKYTGIDSNIVLYEWNIFQHHDGFMSKCLYDIDGVFCIDPPDERNNEQYINYIKNATPLFIPRTPIGGIVTYRLEKNREITKQWLNDIGIRYDELIMFPAKTWDERNKTEIQPEQYKAKFYKEHDNYKLFVESNDVQAKRIYDITKKPVYCVESNKLYTNG
jgi:hypoxanthine phosphoribosyltransferase